VVIVKPDGISAIIGYLRAAVWITGEMILVTMEPRPLDRYADLHLELETFRSIGLAVRAVAWHLSLRATSLNQLRRMVETARQRWCSTFGTQHHGVCRDAHPAGPGAFFCR